MSAAGKLWTALLVGAGIQVVMLALGLHAGLKIGEMCGASLRCYWTLNGIYFVAGLGVGQFLVPWCRLPVRLLVFLAILVAGAAIGLLSTPRT